MPAPPQHNVPDDVGWCCEDLRRHRPQQERYWRVQRWAWGVFALIIIAALVGLTGAQGPFARTQDSFRAGTIDVPIITRVSAADDIRIRFAPGRNQRQVHLSSAFLNAWQIETIQPSADRAMADEKGMTLFFTTRGSQTADVHLFVKAREMGVFNTAISIDTEERVTHRVVVLP